jgi:hypothetical protein
MKDCNVRVIIKGKMFKHYSNVEQILLSIRVLVTIKQFEVILTK